MSRGSITPALLALLRDEFALRWKGHPTDLGGINLNVLVPTDDGPVVVRVYRARTDAERLRSIQHVRRALIHRGLPFVEPRSTVDGMTWAAFEGRVVEVDPYIEGVSMDLERGLDEGMPALGRIHSALRRVDAPEAARYAPVANHIDAAETLEVTRAGVVSIHAMNPRPDELELGRLALCLAEELLDLELRLATLPRQLVHGDFWDNNVLFDGPRISAILDLDFMGERPRVDDLALTLYYTNSTLGPPFDSDERIRRLARLVRSYERALDDALSDDELRALPLALARTVLFTMRYLPELDDDARRRLIGEIQRDVRWSVELVRDVARWQVGLAQRA